MNINGEELVRGTFENIQLAKRHLAEMALNELKKTCFFVTTVLHIFAVFCHNLKFLEKRLCKCNKEKSG